MSGLSFAGLPPAASGSTSSTAEVESGGNGRPRARRRGGGGGGDWGDAGGGGQRRVAGGALAWCLVGEVQGRAANAARPEEKLSVIATTTILHDLAMAIASDHLEVKGLIKPGDDPHIYEPVPADTVTLENADVILFNGYDLEANLMPLISAASATPYKFAVGEAVVPLPSSDTESSSVPDPHVWNDALNAAKIVDAIANAFATSDPPRAKFYRQRASSVVAELKQLHKWIRSSIHSIPANERLLVTTHDAFQYYAKAYGLRIPGTLVGINTEEQPSGRTMRLLVDEIRRVKPRAVFFERTVSPLLIQAVAESAEVTLCEDSLYSDSIGPKGSGAETYAAMMVYNTRVIVQALGGKAPAPPIMMAMVGTK